MRGHQETTRARAATHPSEPGQARARGLEVEAESMFCVKPFYYFYVTVASSTILASTYYLLPGNPPFPFFQLQFCIAAWSSALSLAFNKVRTVSAADFVPHLQPSSLLLPFIQLIFCRLLSLSNGYFGTVNMRFFCADQTHRDQPSSSTSSLVNFSLLLF